ncbi:protein of unknown function (DUF4383) [Promicromonospora umidemergens]|uniref:DUF4383 domain-containing protein n=1 Tax=Promicromonospora umidemergens TaxID=629679 RepID=A0ABP8YA71_9MICO|nr:DUF4383 domain-containing protein [Promicromonospora umidemergens]MCP2286696.1 protein of unknown function (DUF4383) [Promicromonospora umidemergens]
MAHRMPHSQTLALYQWLAFVTAVVYLAVGVAGFFVTGPEGFAQPDNGQRLFGLTIDNLHNVVHLSTGFLGVIMWSGAGRARAFGWSIVVGHGTLFVHGLIAVNNPEIDSFHINVAGRWLHILSVVAGLTIALWPDRGADATSPRSRPAM